MGTALGRVVLNVKFDQLMVILFGLQTVVDVYGVCFGQLLFFVRWRDFDWRLFHCLLLKDVRISLIPVQ